DEMDIHDDGGLGGHEIEGDLFESLAFLQSVEDGFALFGGAAIEDSGFGAFAFEAVPGGFLDFAAVEQAGGEMGDDVVPCAAAEAAGIGDAVADGAGEGGRRNGEVIDVIRLGFVVRMVDRNVRSTEEIEEGLRGKGVEDFSGGLVAGGAEPAPAEELAAFAELAAGVIFRVHEIEFGDSNESLF